MQALKLLDRRLLNDSSPTVDPCTLLLERALAHLAEREPLTAEAT